ncbi:hypothetical protein Nepgr_026192 [Nepenthes gracilis]|uniref:Uncharacterized protein n=1 Tax=Nepenthes gracilis TaxID=150966 RepID=A0AAD3T8G5_NEPGR|nr:hypothetical protein Nepgr_026192 [Nepenthes gracilis]
MGSSSFGTEMNQGVNADVALNIPLKRKRGHPRKDGAHTGRTFNDLPQKIHGQIYDGNAHVPPGFVVHNRNQPCQADAADDPNAIPMVGREVSGVIESAFDAGYLVSIRVSNSDTHLRGVVFEAGQYVPVTAENDVAPHVEMVRRNEVPFPAACRTRVRGRRCWHREKSKHHAAYTSNASPPYNELVQYEGKQILPVAASLQSPVGARGTLVPVVLQPVNLSNGAFPSIEAPAMASQPVHLASSRGKQVQPECSRGVKPKSLETNNGSHSQTHNVEDCKLRLPTMPLDQSVNEVVSTIGGPENQNECVNSIDTTSSKANEQIQDLSHPILTKSVESVRSDILDPFASISQTRTGKMTELLLAVQENLMKKQAADSMHQEFKNLEN